MCIPVVGVSVYIHLGYRALDRDLATLRKIPLVVILGCTGVGKSKLAIELARRFDGEIISADSMQIYAGLDVVTNKVTPSERRQCRHHFVGSVPPFHEYSVVEFRDAALPLIDRLRDDGKLPIVVGGTNYYIESLLWNILVDCRKEASREEASEQFDWLTRLPDDEIYAKLKEIDPDRAARLHPNDVRRIRRSLEVHAQCGRPHSDILAEQRKEAGGGAQGGGMRFPDATVFWLQCDYSVLDPRLDARVDEMIRGGLRDELHWLHRESANQPLAERTKGIFQAIGYKEFVPYLTCVDDGRESEAMFEACAEKLKSATKSYARKQTTWIRNRFLRRRGQAAPDVFGLDTSNVGEWDRVVLSRAIDVLVAKSSGEDPPVAPLDRLENAPETWTKHVCDICDGRVVHGDHEWTVHLASRGHQRRKRQRAKKAAREFARQQQERDA